MAEFMKASAGAAPKDTEGGPVNDETWSAMADAVGVPPADLMKLIMGEGGGPEQQQSAAGPSSSSAAAAAGGEDFQETIRKTMERIHESGEKATAAATEGGQDDILMQVLKAMEASGMGAGTGTDGADDENLDKLFMGIMEQLSNKEMLYEPMKELHDKFGPWLKENRDKTPKEDLERFETQATIVAEIVAKFEEKGFSDDNPEHRDYVWQRMQKVCSFCPFHLTCRTRRLIYVFSSLRTDASGGQPTR